MGSADSQTEGTTGSEVWRRWRNLAVPAAIAAAALALYGGLLSFRGLGPATLEAVSVGDGWGGLTRPHPLYGLLAHLAGRISSDPPIALLRGASLVFAVGSLPAIWGLGRKLGGFGTAVAATVVFAVLPQTVGLATAITAGSLFLFLWCWFLRLSVVDRHDWATTPVIWILGGALVLVWPVVLLWGALWLYLEVRAGATATDTRRLSGEIAPATVPLAIAVAPVAVLLVATAMHPEFWAAPLQSWGEFLKNAMSWTGPVFRFDGVAYRHARPPMWVGLPLVWWTLPAVVVAGAGIGWLQSLRDPSAGSRGERLARKVVLWGPLFALSLPWIHRGPAFGRIEFTYVMLPMLALSTGRLLDGAFGSLRRVTAHRFGERLGAGVAGLVVGATLLSVLGTSVRIHPVEGSYYNRLAGGLGGAVDQGLRISRDGVFPVSALRPLGASDGEPTVFVVGHDSLTSVYEDAGLLPHVPTTDDAHSADRLVRQLGAFRPGSGGVRTNPAALVSVGRDTRPLLRADGVPLIWLERQTTP